MRCSLHKVSAGHHSHHDHHHRNNIYIYQNSLRYCYHSEPVFSPAFCSRILPRGFAPQIMPQHIAADFAVKNIDPEIASGVCPRSLSLVVLPRDCPRHVPSMPRGCTEPTAGLSCRFVQRFPEIETRPSRACRCFAPRWPHVCPGFFFKYFLDFVYFVPPASDDKELTVLQ